MKSTLKLLMCLVLIAGFVETMAQQNLMYNHYYINPFLYNPSFIAQSGYSELHLNYRKQWAGFEGAPQTATMNLQLPLSYKSGLAFTGFQDKAGLIKTTTGLVSFSYQIFLGRSIVDLHKVGFGISAGYTNSRISSEDSYDFQDPVLGNNTSSLDGQFGMHYQNNRFKAGFAIPRLFQNNVASEEKFTHRGITQIKNTITSISYDFMLSPFLSFEPVLTYRTYENLDPQYEALASLKLSKTGWIGAAYRQDYGMFAFLGLDVKEKLKVGYAYEFATEQTDKIGYGSHEVHLVVRLGRRQFTRPTALGKTSSSTPSRGNISESSRHEEEEAVEERTEPEEQEPIDQNSYEESPAYSVSPDPVLAEVESVNEKNQDPSETTSKAQKDEASEPTKNPVKLNGDSLPPGHYVVVGVFIHLQNALDYTSTLKRAGYPANVAFNPEKRQYIVHMRNAPTVEEARQQRDQYRQMSRYSFRDTWVLSVD